MSSLTHSFGRKKTNGSETESKNSDAQSSEQLRGHRKHKGWGSGVTRNLQVTAVRITGTWFKMKRWEHWRPQRHRMAQRRWLSGAECPHCHHCVGGQLPQNKKGSEFIQGNIMQQKTKFQVTMWRKVTKAKLKIRITWFCSMLRFKTRKKASMQDFFLKEKKMRKNRKKNAGHFWDTGQHFPSLLMSYLPGWPVTFTLHFCYSIWSLQM